MPTFTPPTREEASSDPFWGRYSIPVGQSVVRVNGTFTLMPYPALSEIAGLTEGVDWFQGGRTYSVSEDVANELDATGFDVGFIGYGQGLYGAGLYGG